LHCSLVNWMLFCISVVYAVVHFRDCAASFFLYYAAPCPRVRRNSARPTIAPELTMSSFFGAISEPQAKPDWSLRASGSSRAPIKDTHCFLYLRPGRAVE